MGIIRLQHVLQGLWSLLKLGLPLRAASFDTDYNNGMYHMLFESHSTAIYDHLKGNLKLFEMTTIFVRNVYSYVKAFT